MKDLFNNFYHGILRFTPLKLFYKIESNRSGSFPPIGFLNETRKQELEKALGIEIKHPEFFEQALTHRSYLQVLNDTQCFSNERLEFLGDAVLGMVIADYLFFLYANELEGELTKMRSWLVNRKTLAYCSRELKLDTFIMMSYGAAKSLEHGSESILADSLESVIAAIYIDSGLEAARKFIYNSLLPIIANKNIMHDANYKSILLETVQAKGYSAPKYLVLDERGPDHDKEFTVGVYIDELLLGEGDGKSKKQAEQTAAQQALTKVNVVLVDKIEAKTEKKNNQEKNDK
jgi:ribonuclease III